MKLGIVLNSNNPETAWNALRLGNQARKEGHVVSLFLLGSGVEMETIEDKTFDVGGALRKFLDSGGDVMACGTCLTVRHQEAGVCPVSTMSELVKVIAESDKVVTLG